MGLLTAFNALLECFVTGIFAALSIWVLAKLGVFPVMFLAPLDDLDEEGDER